MSTSERHLRKLARSSHNRFVSAYDRALAAGVTVDRAVAVMRDFTSSGRYFLVFPDSVAVADKAGGSTRIAVDNIAHIRHDFAHSPHPHMSGGMESTVLEVTGADGTVITFESHWSLTLHARLLLQDSALRRDNEVAHSVAVMDLIQQSRPLWSQDRRTPEQRRRSSLRVVAGLSTLVVVLGATYAVASRSEPEPPAGSAMHAERLGSGTGSGSPNRSQSGTSSLRYSGDPDAFERGLNTAMPWTAEISQHILVSSAQDICDALERTGDPVAARDLAIEFGFEFQDTAMFVQDSVTFFCPQFRSLVPQMSNP